LPSVPAPANERQQFIERPKSTILPVVVLGRQLTETEQGFVVPGYVSTQTASSATCSADTRGTVSAYDLGGIVTGTINSTTTADCHGRSTSNTTVSPPRTVRYTVRGATFSLQLPDRRVAVVNCDSKVNWTEFSMNPRRSCRIPTVSRFSVDFSGDKAKLIWRVGVNGEKIVSETYTLIEILEPQQR
jgi:hypothetical protein